VQPSGGGLQRNAREYLLPYDKVFGPLRIPMPHCLLYLQSTYEAAAESAKWDRGALECSRGEAGVPRKV